MKSCIKCGISKSLSEFQKRAGSPDGYRNDCRECSLLRMARNNKIRMAKPHRCGTKGCGIVLETAVNRCPEHQHIADMKRLYNITPLQYSQILTAQGGACAICGALEPGGKYGKWQIDHDHITNMVRGLLCQGCNVALGMVKENETTLLNAIEYLRRHKVV